LVSVPGSGTRPTADRVREALFDRLASRYGLCDRRVLDLFAGTGALGIEALSRGALSLVSVDNSRPALLAIRGNLKACGFEDRAQVLTGRVESLLPKLAARGLAFDGVFVDPPYGEGLALSTLAAVDSLGLLLPGGFASVESDRREPMPERVGSLARLRRDVYGDTVLALYECDSSGSESG
jgi:16S rRNA (guanine(966)-N(2))-methyltransferase RsmD